MGVEKKSPFTGRLICGAVMICAMTLTGCHDAKPGSGGQATVDQVTRMPIEPSIVGVAAFYKSFDPWIWSEDKSRPRGIRIQALYLIGPEGKGKFGDGVIQPKMYNLEQTEDGGLQPVLIREWAFDVELALPFRTKAEWALGWGYLLPLTWDDLDLRGKEIRMIVNFIRPDGLVVKSRKKDFRVPGLNPH